MLAAGPKSKVSMHASLERKHSTYISQSRFFPSFMQSIRRFFTCCVSTGQCLLVVVLLIGILVALTKFKK